VLDGVFYQELQGEGRDFHLRWGVWQVPGKLQAFAESFFFHGQVIPNKGQFFCQGHRNLAGMFKAAAQKAAQFNKELLCQSRVFLQKGLEGVERIEEEMGAQLASQSCQASFVGGLKEG